MIREEKQDDEAKGWNGARPVSQGNAKPTYYSPNDQWIQMIVLCKLTLRILERRVVRSCFLPVLENTSVQIHVLVFDIGVRGNAPALESLCNILRQNSANPSD